MKNLKKKAIIFAVAMILAIGAGVITPFGGGGVVPINGIYLIK
ncbi:hypothetical protein [Clostridium sp. C8-1-8]|nr:hypothetical protein [Clostridium sp. C8-1-8]